MHARIVTVLDDSLEGIVSECQDGIIDANRFSLFVDVAGDYFNTDIVSAGSSAIDRSFTERNVAGGNARHAAGT